MPALKIAGNGTNDSLGTGRRKSSIARVRIRPGSGQIAINGRDLDSYFPLPQDRNNVMASLEATGKASEVDVIVTVHGGGVTGQSGAIKLGIARALKNFDTGTEDALREKGLLTRDGRMKERKKPGLHGARRGTQFSKR
ncbi:MAG: 30S ribosomal protein S9 [Pirellulales bacterium]|nr:30S ribosomal protein S9 [Planctomycetales bacterium]